MKKSLLVLALVVVFSAVMFAQAPAAAPVMFPTQTVDINQLDANGQGIGYPYFEPQGWLPTFTDPAGYQIFPGVVAYGVLDVFEQNTYLGHTVVNHPMYISAMNSSGLYASRWGFKGAIGKGNTKATMALEEGFNLNDGTFTSGTQQFGRQAWVGIQNSKYGEVRFGRQNSFMFLDLGPFEANYTGTQASAITDMNGSGTQGAGGYTVRFSNVMTYYTPKIKGIWAGVAYCLGAQQGDLSRGACYQGQIFYQTKHYIFNYNYQQVNNLAATDNTHNNFFGAQAHYGRLKLYVFDHTSKDHLLNVNRNLFDTSVGWTFNKKESLNFSYGHMFDESSKVINAHAPSNNFANMYSVMNLYRLFPRTHLYQAFTILENHGVAQNNPGFANYTLAGAATSGYALPPGTSTKGLQLGIAQLF